MTRDEFLEMDRVLDDPLIHIINKDHDTGYYEFTIGELETPLFLKSGRYLTSEHTFWEQSHAIHTPTQAGPYWTSNPSSGSPALALSRAIDGLLSYYKEAESQGHRPSEDWLVEG